MEQGERIMKEKIAVVLIVFLLAGCAATADVEPVGDPIDINEAVLAIMDALDQATIRADKPVHGIYPAQAEVTLVLTGKRNEKDEQSLEVVPTNIIKEIPKYTAGWSTEAESTASNTLKITFKNVYAEKEGYFIEILREICPPEDATKNCGERLKEFFGKGALGAE
jgi:hypothetical protein